MVIVPCRRGLSMGYYRHYELNQATLFRNLPERPQDRAGTIPGTIFAAWYYDILRQFETV
jgi:hypothetical protein